MLELQKQEVELRADGGFDIQVFRFKNGESRAELLHLAYVIPGSRRPEPDVVLYPRGLLRELAADDVPPKRLIF